MKIHSPQQEVTNNVKPVVARVARKGLACSLEVPRRSIGSVIPDFYCNFIVRSPSVTNCIDRSIDLAIYFQKKKLAISKPHTQHVESLVVLANPAQASTRRIAFFFPDNRWPFSEASRSRWPVVSMLNPNRLQPRARIRNEALDPNDAHS
jgi:hypothetical protein